MDSTGETMQEPEHGVELRAGCEVAGSTTDDVAATPLLQFIAALAIFAIAYGLAAGYTVGYASTLPSGEAANLQAIASGGLTLLLESPGVPEQWHGEPETTDGVGRVGLRSAEGGGGVDPFKLMRLHGGGLTASANARLDYEEARTGLGLQDHEFHLRVSPALPPKDDGRYGIVGMDGDRVGYIGDFDSDGVTESAASARESAVIDRLPPLFENWRFDPASPHLGGDKFPDRKQVLEGHLPLRLAGWRNTESGEGDPAAVGTYTWRIYPAADVVDIPPPAGTHVAAMGSSSGTGYDAAENDRLVSPSMDLHRMESPELILIEYIDGSCLTVDGACSTLEDYGLVEVSSSGAPGTWTELLGTRTATSHGAWRTRTIDLAGCIPCRDGPVHIGLRWTSTGDTGDGWFLDEVRVMDAATSRVAWETNSSLGRSYYEVLVVGSNVDQTAMAPATVKNLLRDWVLAGGNLYVLGSTAQNDEWMQPIFGAGLGVEGSQQPYAPDPTHPLLRTPNRLTYESYVHQDNVWRMSPGSQSKFYQVIGTPAASGGDRGDVLGISVPGAYGNGTVILTTYLGYQMNEEQFAKLLANFLMYGRYGVLYLDYGPPVPTWAPVAYAERLVLVPATQVPEGPLVELRFTMYAWRP